MSFRYCGASETAAPYGCVRNVESVILSVAEGSLFSPSVASRQLPRQRELIVVLDLGFVKGTVLLTHGVDWSVWCQGKK